ncbi:helix-turn-helix domain-containing protein [Bacillus idriensis]|uniref:Helix-turn-helix domain-containing protein n=2 Tax=Metabacillus idriensis TaxID=324768 RepID=A0A6I2MG02_9BACI|nr:helix-turn-helix domain-containing protein [Metabacillus idriensis]
MINLQTKEDVTNPQENTERLKYPMVMSAKDVAEILGVNVKFAYEIMDREDFPLIRLGRIKKVNRDMFFTWLEQGHV